MIAPFQLLLPGRILFGRGEAAKTAGLAAGLGSRILLVHGRDAARALEAVACVRLVHELRDGGGGARV